MRMVDDDENIESVVKKEEVSGNYHEITDLPSNFLLYPKGTKLFGRTLKVSEVKKLSSMNEDNYNSIIKEVLSNCIKGINVDEIYNADKLYLIFWLRANTYKNPNFVASYICEHCGKKSDYHFDIGSFEVSYLDINFKPEPIKLLNSETEIVVDFPKIKDEERILAFKKVLENGLTKYDDDTVTIAGMIKTINGQSVNIRKACEYLSTLEDYPEDYALLHSKILELDFGIIPEISCVCNHSECKKVNKIPVNFRPEFFIPKFKS